VCGSHTMAIHRHGLPGLLPGNINLVSGPGCPVCVTHKSFIDKSIAFSRLKNVIITTFGDLVRVPGSTSSLDREKAANADIRIVYSSLEALDIARNNPEKQIVFLGVGFETTAPTSAMAVIEAVDSGINNFYIFSSHKIMPPAMMALISEGIKINGYICPGHVSAITGAKIFIDIVDKYGLGCVVSGFEPVDIMQSVLMLVTQLEKNEPRLEIEYKRAVTQEGNVKAQKIMNDAFDVVDDYWRGFGIIGGSGLKLKKKFEKHDADKMIEVEVEETREDKGCICGLILKGLNSPGDCKLFRKVCNPENPVGACMVSSEGACHAFYKYN
jgi:hydrogenase expression/formation protein HypD